MKLVERNDSWGTWFEVETSDKSEIYMGFKMIDGVLYSINGDYIAYQPEYAISDVIEPLDASDALFAIAQCKYKSCTPVEAITN